MTSPLVGTRINIVRRNAVSDIVRKATRFAPFYSRELYISTKLLKKADRKIDRVCPAPKHPRCAGSSTLSRYRFTGAERD